MVYGGFVGVCVLLLVDVWCVGVGCLGDFVCLL